MFLKVLIFHIALLPILVTSFILPHNAGVKDFELLGSGLRGQNTKLRYYLSTYKATQAKAATDCESVYNGKLVSILNGIEDADISLLLSSALPSGYIHTSGSRNSVGQPFIWSAMNPPLPASHFKWAPGAPNSLPESLCISVGRSVGVYQWYASSCTREELFICEI